MALSLASGRVCRLLSVGVVAGGWLVIGAAWLLNRDWFSFLHGAFSDLGSARARYPLVFNYGLMAVAVLLALFSLCLYRVSRERLETVGAAYLGLAAVFLAQVGLFPEGSVFHYCVALWFFLLTDGGLLLYSLGAARAGGRCCRASLVLSALMLPGAAAVAATVGWPSTAALEAYAILLLDASMLCLGYCISQMRGH